MNAPTTQSHAETIERNPWFDRPPLSDRSPLKSEKRRAVSRRALLLALAPNPKSFYRLLNRPAASRIEWDWLVNRAIAHKVAGLLASRIEAEVCPAQLSEETISRLTEWADRTRQRSQLGARTLAIVARHLNRSGIRFANLKGRFLNEKAYRDPHARASSDVDLLVPIDRLADAEKVLLKLGFEFFHGRMNRKGLSSEAMRKWLTAHDRHWTYRAPESMVDVELHWNPADPRVARLPVDDLWEETEATRLAGVDMLTLSPEANLLHVCWHATEKGPYGARLLHFCDVAWFLGRLSDSLSEERLLNLARRWHLERVLCGSILACRQLFGMGLKAYDDLIGRLDCDVNRFLSVATPEDIVDQRLEVEVSSRMRRTTRRRIKLAKWDIGLGRRPGNACRGLWHAYRVSLAADLRTLAVRKAR